MASVFKAVWSVGPVTLVDVDNAAFGWLDDDQFGQAAQVQADNLCQGATAFRYGRGNLHGPCSFWALKTHASYDTAAAYLKAELARAGQNGTLTLTLGTTTFAMANAVLEQVIMRKMLNISLTLRYVFAVRGIA